VIGLGLAFMVAFCGLALGDDTGDATLGPVFLEEQIQSLHRQLDSVKDGLEPRIERLESAIDRRLDRLDGIRADFERRLDHLVDEKADFERKLDRLDSVETDFERRIGRIESRIAATDRTERHRPPSCECYDWPRKVVTITMILTK
jgi:chaperonin cofactor prefoldin